VVHRASQPGETVLAGTLADIADQVEEAGLRQAAVVLVGRALARDDVNAAESYLYSSTRSRSD
jgi:precorrin-4/cobalt-precorrin-4 C11-methyltransferase